MDDLEFRRRAYADPDDKSPEFLSASASCLSNRQFLDELKVFNHKLSKALEEPVPDALPDKLMLSHLLRQPDRETRRWQPLAVAASVAFALGFATRFITFSPQAVAEPPSVAQVAVSHVLQEIPFTHYVDEEVTLNTVNAKLRPYGTRLQSLNSLGKVYYANHCMFAGGPAAHLVIQGEHERVHVFLVPMERALRLQDRFSEDNLHGEVLSMSYNRLVVVSDRSENVSRMAEQVKASLEKSI
ncbi:DUF3379 domain-containing protein [Oceanimonas baumannii]|uniref:Uncharacterized protein DUF3379 n=1 Tax=Oceanimonas baumannii TaxID=129578 RepID=A0A235CKZ1_9GAMM|nr:DUF3379 domain-containing protein [Oceanimonas baumannii]OYD25210.1 hypothetical protein B6S09_05895 [Oceanimonas baumannii]TDW62497.1 uncharacterized protein DUF3379 [Oceanimonas baumannii]